MTQVCAKVCELKNIEQVLFICQPEKFDKSGGNTAYIFLLPLLATVTIKNDVNLEIKRRITLANNSYYGLNRQLSGRDLSRTIKEAFYPCFFMT